MIWLQLLLDVVLFLDERPAGISCPPGHPWNSWPHLSHHLSNIINNKNENNDNNDNIIYIAYTRSTTVDNITRTTADCLSRSGTSLRLFWPSAVNYGALLYPTSPPMTTTPILHTIHFGMQCGSHWSFPCYSTSCLLILVEFNKSRSSSLPRIWFS